MLACGSRDGCCGARCGVFVHCCCCLPASLIHSTLPVQPFGHRHVETSGSANTSSSVLLAKMSSRNACRSDLEEQQPYAIGATAPPTGATAGVSEEHGEFLRELRRFIAVQANVNGQATTEEILHHFNHKVPSGGVAIFKSLLNEICTFYRQSGRGIWYLKEEYR